MGILNGVVLMVFLPAVERIEWNDLRHDWLGKHARTVELLHIGQGRLSLLLIDVKDCGTITATDIGSLAIQLRWIMHHGEEDSQQRAVAHISGLATPAFRLLDDVEGFK